MEIKDLICEKRKEKRFTQRKLGELMGYEGRTAETVVQNWEYGKQPVPITKLRRLAEVLEVTLDELIP